MSKFFRFCFLVFAMGISAAAFAHGPQMQITNDGNKIMTRQILTDTYSPITAETRIYSMPLKPVSGNINGSPTNYWQGQPDSAYTNGPGLAYGLDTDPFITHVDNSDIFLAAGNHFEVLLLDSLKVWNGASFVDPGTEQAKLIRVSGTPGTIVDSATTTDAGPASVSEDVLVYGNISSINPGSHSAAQVTLLGDGATFDSTPDDGLYLLQMKLISTQSNVLESAPYFFLLNKGMTSFDEGNAISFLQSSYNISTSQVQTVPEPATWLGVGACLISGLVWKRKQRAAFSSIRERY